MEYSRIFWLIFCASIFFFQASFSVAETHLLGTTQIVSTGEVRSLKDLAVPGCITLIDFYASWSPAGVTLSPELDKLARTCCSKVVLRRVRIESWEAPILARYKVRALPFVLVLDENGCIRSRGLKGFRQARRILQGSPLRPAASAEPSSLSQDFG